MLNILKDPSWNGIAAVVAIITLVITIYKEKELLSLFPRIAIILLKMAIGIIIVSLGVPLHITMNFILEGGIPLVSIGWQFISKQYGFLGFIVYSLQYGFLPGSLTVALAMRGKTLRQSMWLGIFAAFLTTFLGDLWFSQGELHADMIFFNLIGGFIIGPIVAQSIFAFDILFGIRRTKLEEQTPIAALK